MTQVRTNIFWLTIGHAIAPDCLPSRCPQMDLFSFGGAHNEEDEGQDDVRIWYTSLDEFRPLNQRFHTGKFMESYYAKSIKTGQHLVVKKYIKGTQPADPLTCVATPDMSFCRLRANYFTRELPSTNDVSAPACLLQLI